MKNIYLIFILSVVILGFALYNFFSFSGTYNKISTYAGIELNGLASHNFDIEDGKAAIKEFYNNRSSILLGELLSLGGSLTILIISLRENDKSSLKVICIIISFVSLMISLALGVNIYSCIRNIGLL